MYELRVLSGLHQGATLPLVGERWVIGSRDDGDLALHDQGVAAVHCRLQYIDECWTVHAEQGIVSNDEGHSHQMLALTPGTTIVVGSVWLSLSHAQAEWQSATFVTPAIPDAETQPVTDSVKAHVTPPLYKVASRSWLFGRTSGVVMGLLIGVVGSAWSLNRAPSSNADSLSEPPVHAVPKGDKRVVLTSIEAARLQLNKMLSDRLLNDVDVQQTAGGLRLSGALTPEALLVYQRMLQRFNDSYAAPIALIDDVSTSSTGLPFEITQIVSGLNAHLITLDGHRLYIGDEYQGLRLVRLDDQQIEFDGDKHYVVRW